VQARICSWRRAESPSCVCRATWTSRLRWLNAERTVVSGKDMEVISRWLHAHSCMPPTPKSPFPRTTTNLPCSRTVHYIEPVTLLYCVCFNNQSIAREKGEKGNFSPPRPTHNTSHPDPHTSSTSDPVHARSRAAHDRTRPPDARGAPRGATGFPTRPLRRGRDEARPTWLGAHTPTPQRCGTAPRPHTTASRVHVHHAASERRDEPRV
jgi:hypothetical protein